MSNPAHNDQQVQKRHVAKKTGLPLGRIDAYVRGERSPAAWVRRLIEDAGIQIEPREDNYRD